MKNKGFTLIELLVVIAIIGILSAIVLASLDTARNKGVDAATKADLDDARAQAENFYDSQTPTNTYTGVCTNAGGIANMINAVTSNSGSAAFCMAKADGSAWAAGGVLKGGGSWCVDNTGTSTYKGTLVATSNC